MQHIPCTIPASKPGGRPGWPRLNAAPGRIMVRATLRTSNLGHPRGSNPADSTIHTERRDEMPKRDTGKRRDETPKRDSTGKRRDEMPKRDFTGKRRDEMPKRDTGKRRDEMPKRDSTGKRRDEMLKRDFTGKRRDETPKRDSTGKRRDEMPKRDFTGKRRDEMPKRDTGKRRDEMPKRDTGKRTPLMTFVAALEAQLDPRCVHCVFYRADERTDRGGVCRHRSPTANPEGREYGGVYPHTAASGACGDWRGPRV